MKVKFFTNIGDVPELEREVNQWLAENKDKKILEIKQGFAYDNEQSFYTLVTVWYEEETEGWFASGN